MRSAPMAVGANNIAFCNFGFQNSAANSAVHQPRDFERFALGVKMIEIKHYRVALRAVCAAARALHFSDKRQVFAAPFGLQTNLAGFSLHGHSGVVAAVIRL